MTEKMLSKAKIRTNAVVSVPAVSSIASPDWSRVPERGHGVQFYLHDQELLRLLSRYVGTALIGGDVAVVVATRAHRRALDQRLAANGLDVAVARAQGRYLVADAQATLDKFVVGGRVDRVRAETVVGALLRRANRVTDDDGRPARVFAFGEMVALLTASSGPEEALALEAVWNGLASTYAFTLCCAYPMGSFSQRHAASFVRICATHTHVFHASEAQHRTTATAT
jgi:MEDS: MEthanogen/methylotroph, DcmR Sensory domain